MGKKFVNSGNNKKIRLGECKPSLYFDYEKTSLKGRLSSSFKRAFLLCLLFFTVVTLLSATSLKWSWTKTDDDIAYYRWQLNGVDDDKWNLLDSKVTSVTLKKENDGDTFFLEASYDGISWSEPSSCTYTKTTEDNKVDYSTKRYELSYVLSPYSYQYVRYTGNHNPGTRASYYGIGGGIAFNYNFEKRYSAGATLTYNWHNYKDFHYYNSIKAEASMRYRIYESGNSMIKLYLLHSYGIDFVLRDDGDRGVYAVFGIIGITEDLRVRENVSLNWGGNLSYTFQNGSNVLHFTPSVGVTYHFGEDA